MPKPRSTAKLVVTSVVISFVVIAIFALVFLNYIVPAYQVTEDQIYSVLIKLFPILIGLILIQIGVMIAKRHEDEFADQVEKKGLDDVIITQSGVIEGVKEPAIQIHTPSLGLVTYAGIKKSDVEKILDETVMGGKLIADLQVEA